MTTIKLPKHYSGTGTTTPRVELKPKLKILPCRDKKCGKNWFAVYEDGFELNLHLQIGRNGFSKKSINLTS